MIQRQKKAEPLRNAPLILELPLAEGINVSRVGTVKLDIICTDTGASVTLKLRNNRNVDGGERRAVLRLGSEPLGMVLMSDITMVLVNGSGKAAFSVDEDASGAHEC